MKRALLFVSLCFAATPLFASDNPWKNKPYQNWNAKDLQAIMTDSPWVDVSTIRRSWGPPQTTTMVQPVQQEIAGGVRSDPTVMGTVASDTGGTEASQQLNVYLYWYSSRVIRAASAREAVLHGLMDQSAIKKFIDAPEAEYKIVLRMADMTPFLEKDVNFYRENAMLQMKHSRVKLPPSNVLYEHMGTISEDVVFFFPKKTFDGAPTISSDETDVVFSCKIADQTVRADFKPKKMVDQFGADL